MAYQTNVHHFARSIKLKKDYVITDPNCGKKMKHSQSRHVLFRGGEPLYFCSEGCEQEYAKKHKGKNY